MYISKCWMAGGHFRGNVSFWWNSTTNPPGPFHQYLLQAWPIRKLKRRRLTKRSGLPRLRKQQGVGYGHPVVLTVVAPLGRHGVCVVLSSCVQLRKVVLGCLVSSISCICLVGCVLGNFQVDWCSYYVLRTAFTSLSGYVLSPFASVCWFSGPVCCPPLPLTPRPFSFGDLRCTELSRSYSWDHDHSYCLGKAPLSLGFILFFPFCPSLQFHIPALFQPHSSVFHVHSSSPLAVFCFIYVCGSRFYFVFSIWCFWPVSVFLYVNLVHLFWLLPSMLSFYRPSRLQSAVQSSVTFQQTFLSPLILCEKVSGIYLWRSVRSLNICIFNFTEFQLSEMAALRLHSC